MHVVEPEPANKQHTRQTVYINTHITYAQYSSIFTISAISTIHARRNMHNTPNTHNVRDARLKLLINYDQVKYTPNTHNTHWRHCGSTRILHCDCLLLKYLPPSLGSQKQPVRWNTGGISHRAFLCVHGGEPLAWLPYQLWRRSRAEYEYVMDYYCIWWCTTVNVSSVCLPSPNCFPP